MALGKNYPYPKSFSNDFQDFLEALNRASVTYEVEPFTVNEVISETPDVRFNLVNSPQGFEKSMQRDFVAACDEIEKALEKTIDKQDKLSFIARHTVEVEGIARLLIKDASGRYTHRKFKFRNISEDAKYAGVTLTEDAFQDYYFWMEHFTGKMQSYLLHLKDMVCLIPQDHVKLPAALLPNPNASTLQSPLGFFDFLLMRDGITALLEDFKPTQEDLEWGNVSYDSKTQTKSEHFIDNETGEWDEYVSRFSEDYAHRLSDETVLSRQLIQERIQQMKSEQEAKYFLTVIVQSLQHLYSLAVNSKAAKKYDASRKPFIVLLQFCYNRYAEFCPDLKEDLSTLVRGNVTNKLPDVPKQLPLGGQAVTGFRIMPDVHMESLVVILVKNLSDAGMMEKDADTDLAKAFSGKPYEHRLRIRWTDKSKNSQPNKHSLFYLLERLMENKLIERVNEKIYSSRKLNTCL